MQFHSVFHCSLNYAATQHNICLVLVCLSSHNVVMKAKLFHISYKELGKKIFTLIIFHHQTDVSYRSCLRRLLSPVVISQMASAAFILKLTFTMQPSDTMTCETKASVTALVEGTPSQGDSARILQIGLQAPEMTSWQECRQTEATGKIHTSSRDTRKTRHKQETEQTMW